MLNDNNNNILYIYLYMFKYKIMKKHLLQFFSVSLLLCFVNISNNSVAQTDGTLTFTFNQPQPTSPSGTKNVIAVWIENGSGTFIKTKMRYWGGGTSDHLPTWKTKSGQNVTDATTGATRTSTTNPTAFGSKTVTWDGKDVNGTQNGTTVADGTYKVWVESSWQTSLASNTHNDIISFTFTKGPAADHQTPSGDNYFNTISVDWVPATSSVSDLSLDQSIDIYPNPTSDFININFHRSISECQVRIENTLGQTIYSEKPTQINVGNKNIDVSQFSKGIYFVVIQAKDQTTKQKILIQ